MNLKQPLKDLSGKALTDEGGELTVGKMLARILSGSKSKDSMRNWVLAQALYKEEVKDLNNSDWEFIEECVAEHEGFTPLVTGQLLEILSTRKKDEPKPN